MTVPTIELNNGVTIPQLGFGVEIVLCADPDKLRQSEAAFDNWLSQYAARSRHDSPIPAVRRAPVPAVRQTG